MICEPCGADDWEPTRHVNVFGTGASLMRCRACGFKTYDRVVVGATEFYNTPAAYKYVDETVEYGSPGRTDKSNPDEHRAHLDAYYGSLIGLAETFAGKIVSAYDVGVNVGQWLQSCRRRGVTRLHGCDVNSHAVEVARAALGTWIDIGLFQEVPGPAESVCMVSMFDVVEHTWSPRADLEKARRILRPGGILVLKTFYDEYHDTLDGLDLSPEAEKPYTVQLKKTGYFSPTAHPSHFESEVLRQLIKRVGFTQCHEQPMPAFGQTTIWALKVGG